MVPYGPYNTYAILLYSGAMHNSVSANGFTLPLYRPRDLLTKSSMDPGALPSPMSVHTVRSIFLIVEDHIFGYLNYNFVLSFMQCVRLCPGRRTSLVWGMQKLNQHTFWHLPSLSVETTLPGWSSVDRSSRAWRGPYLYDCTLPRNLDHANSCSCSPIFIFCLIPHGANQEGFD